MPPRSIESVVSDPSTFLASNHTEQRSTNNPLHVDRRGDLDVARTFRRRNAKTLSLARHDRSHRARPHHHHHHHRPRRREEEAPNRRTVRPSTERGYEKMIHVDHDDDDHDDDLDRSRLSFHWNDPGDVGGVLDVRVRYEGAAWLGVGFASSSSSSDVVVVVRDAVVGDLAERRVRRYELVGGDWSTPAQLLPRSRQTLRDARIARNDHDTTTTTTMSFRRSSSPSSRDEDDVDAVLSFAVGSGERYRGRGDAGASTFLVALDLSDDVVPRTTVPSSTPTTTTSAATTTTTTVARAGLWAAAAMPVVALVACVCVSRRHARRRTRTTFSSSARDRRRPLEDDTIRSLFLYDDRRDDLNEY